VVLQPANKAGLSSLLSGLYTPGSADYGHWLAVGQFDSEFAPSQATVQAITKYLQGRLQPSYQLTPAGSSGQGGGGEPSCEIPYPTTLAQLEAIPINGPFNGYGGGPSCTGLTPSQTNSIYHAPNAGPPPTTRQPESAPRTSPV
jgi:Pro-kumamolisin, activation domain